MSITPGSRVGPYEVIALIGEGGMGKVYRAADTNLKRSVAIKVLPDAFASDPERLARFRREAEVLARLNHPNIAQIYGLENRDVETALVMELVEGATLADRIAQGRIPVDETLRIAKQIADALAAAHEQGIVHRDLKPANIKLRDDGTVKVLDFGLAKAFDSDAAIAGEYALSNSPTLSIPAHMTRVGVLLGTAAYMSPEQARGLGVDKRTDIWAFGCVLYEMLSGRSAFALDTVTDTIAAILEREPDWARLPVKMPAGLQALLRHCLEKDSRRRLRDIADARIYFDGSIHENVKGPGVAHRRNARTLAAMFLGGAVTAAFVTTEWLRWSASEVIPEYTRVVRLTSGPDREFAPAISPDGKWVAYLSDAGGQSHVWVKFLAGSDAVNLTAAAGLEITSGTEIGGLEISPDGTRIAVMARTRGSELRFATWELPAPLPGVPRKLLSESRGGMRWSPDGNNITFIVGGAASGDGLFIADADGGNQRRLIERRDGMHIHWPAWAPDGYVYFLRTFNTVSNLDQSEIYRIHASGTQPMEPVIETLRRAQFPLPLLTGGLIYSANPDRAESGLWWTSDDRKTARPLTRGVGEYAEPRASADGRMVVATLYEQRQGLIRVTTNGGAVSSGAFQDVYHGDLDPISSPTAERIVFSSSRDGNRHIWTSRPDGSDPRPVTSGSSQDDRPVFSPDGQQIAFASDRGGARAIWVVSADGGPARKVIDAVLTGGLTWSRDASQIVYSGSAGAGPGLWKVSVAGGSPERVPTPFFASEPAWSPTQDALAYMSSRRINEVSFTSVGFVDPSGRILYSDLPDPPGAAGFANGMLAWSRDGRRVAVVRQQAGSPASIWLLDPASPTPYTQLIEFPPGPRIRGLTWTSDGQALIVGRHDWTSDIVLMDQSR